MNSAPRTLLHYAIFIALTVLLCDLQSSLWIQFFGFSPAPLLWVLVLVYWVLYRRFIESLIMLYIITYILSLFTTAHFGLLCFNLHCILFIIYFIKGRLYLEGPLYFMAITATACFIFPPLHSLNNVLLTKLPWIYPDVFSWIMNILLTMLASLPTYQLFVWVDSKVRSTHKKALEKDYL